MKSIARLLLLGAMVLVADVGHAKRIAIDPEERVTLSAGEKSAWGQLFIPAGTGPFPAMVLLHDRIGLHTIHRAWAERLVGWGYVALLVDSLAPRGTKSGRGLKRLQQAGDGLAALRYLQGLGQVDPERIGVMGWSMGGKATLMALASGPEDATQPAYFAENARFRLGIAYYPPCLDNIFYAPLLILVGDKDNVSYGTCSFLAEKGEAGGRPVEVVVYPDTTHAFDFGVNGNFGFIKITYNADAERDAFERVKMFLTKNL